MYMCIYIYRERELERARARERERETENKETDKQATYPFRSFSSDPSCFYGYVLHAPRALAIKFLKTVTTSVGIRICGGLRVLGMLSSWVSWDDCL